MNLILADTPGYRLVTPSTEQTRIPTFGHPLSGFARYSTHNYSFYCSYSFGVIINGGSLVIHEVEGH